MASLKEVKTRIASVKSTRKITSAMKMVASSKLHRAQQAIDNMRPYETHLTSIMARFLAALEGDIETPYAEKREVKTVAILVISSNSSLCGAFNANVIKELRTSIEQYKSKNIKVEIYPIGRKVADVVRKAHFAFESDCAALLEHPNYKDATTIAETLMNKFADGTYDKIDIIYQHFASTSHQILMHETYLPVDLQAQASQEEKAGDDKHQLDFIVEPSSESIIQSLVPGTLHLKVFTALLDSLAAEHSARVIAMQLATDNADELIDQLTLTYNKTRQQAITAELLDIIGGSMK